MSAGSDPEKFVFEAVKISANQTKDGWAMVLRLHPDDITLDLLKLPVGQRVGVALVPIEDDDGAFRNREVMKRMEQDHKIEEAAKRRFNTMYESVKSSPYLEVWLEDAAGGLDDNITGSNWREKCVSLEKIVNDLGKIARGE